VNLKFGIVIKYQCF